MDTRASRRAHDDPASMTLGDLIGNEGGLDVIKAETALVAHLSEVAVIVTVEAGSTRVVADLKYYYYRCNTPATRTPDDYMQSTISIMTITCRVPFP